MRVNLPPELHQRFPVAETLRSGAEGVVLRVEDTAGAPFVVKLYNPDLTFDDVAASLLAGADPAHVVRVEATGRSPDGSRYEVLEWCEFGSLRDLLDAGEPLDLGTVVDELAEALAHIHSLRIGGDAEARLVHQDLKPENVLVRSMRPLDLVLGDFGLARMIAGSRHYTNRQQGSRPWAPPSGEAITPGWDWWSLGMIVAEVVAGQHPFRPGGTWMADAAISDLLSQHPVDLSGVDDQRARRLCQGLLTRRTGARWGVEQVRRWRDGEDVPVEVDRAGGRDRARPRPTVEFAGEECDTAEALALAFLRDWDQAQEQVIQRNDGGALHQQVTLLLKDEGLGRALELLKDTSGPPARLANLLVEMHPDLPPEYKGNDLRPTEIARRLTDPASTATELRLIEDPKYGLLETGILHCWRSLEGMDRTGEVARRLRTARDFVRNQRSTLDRLGAGAGGGAAVDRAKAMIYIVAVLPERAGTTRQSLAERDTSDADEQAWWHKLAGLSGDYAPALALATEPVARTATEAARAAERAAAETAARVEATARRQERERDQRERRARVNGLRPADLRVLWWVLFLLLPGTGVGFWRLSAPLEPDAGPTEDPGALFEAAPWPMIRGALAAGAFVALGIGAVILLRRGRFGDRPVGLALAGLLVIGAAVSYAEGLGTARDGIAEAQVAMFTNPIPSSRIDTCGGIAVWTNDDAGTRTFVADDCRTVHGYRGWFEQWTFADDGTIGALAGLGPVFLVTDESSERMIALDQEGGARLWEKSCGDGISLDEAMFDAGDSTPGGQVVAGTCDGAPFRLDPATGAPV